MPWEGAARGNRVQGWDFKLRRLSYPQNAVLHLCRLPSLVGLAVCCVLHPDLSRELPLQGTKPVSDHMHTKGNSPHFLLTIGGQSPG